ncbi:extracellular solute-binding protein [Streptomyces iconiensis]|uniref:Extracellular solute-binding protein n=1 Tax=Streptomyces iconiensis TaxID=1384038 RepID=A0ABT7A916_9ACTN|nr:extracellular solute-binding protein [Streptomyces iconiensis]MDJ1137842.1 extracellular solute-binding protein [Streptomyces iconiensis]
MERRRFLGMAATGLAGATGMTALSGCGDGSGSGKVTLKLVAADYGDPGGNNSSQTYWESLADAFTKKNPDISVDVAVHSWSEVDKKVADMVAADEPPDVAQIGAYADYASQGRLYKVSELLSIPVQADFLVRLAEAGEVQRVQYGLPFVSSTRLLFYNKNLFSDAGLDPESPPETWEELKAAALALKKAGVEIPYGLPLGPEEAPAETMMWMLSGGGSYVDNVGNYTINSAANVRTFTWIRDNLVTPGFTGTNPARTDRQELFDAFGRGDVGMLNGHPTLMQQAERRSVSYGTGKIPGKGGPSESNLGVADWMMAFRANGNREQAGKFLDFVYRETNHYAFASRYDLMPVTTSATTRMREDRRHKKLWRFLDQLDTAQFYPVGKVSWAGTSAAIKKNVGEAVTRGGDPKSVLNGLQRKAEAEEKATSSPSK